MANKALAGAYGFSCGSALLGKSDFDLHPPLRAADFYRIEQTIMSTGKGMVDLEETFPDRTGQPKWYATTKMPLRGRDGVVVGLVCVGRDVTERRRLEAINSEQNTILEMIAKNADLPEVLTRVVLFMETQLVAIRGSVLLFEPERNCLYDGAGPSLPAAYRHAIDGLPVGPGVGSCGTAAHMRRDVIVADTTTDPLWTDFRGVAAEFGLRSCWSTPLLSHEGVLLGTFAFYSGDVRVPTPCERKLIEVATRLASIAIERQRSEDRLRFVAHHDALTGLPNRTVLNQLLDEAMGLACANEGRVFVAFIDLDDFKVINDEMGHAAGDDLLKAVAARMRTCIPDCDHLIRIGGDEFVAILNQSGSEAEDILGTLQQLQFALTDPVMVGARSCELTCSIGISVFPEDGTRVQTLLSNADAAMYHAKNTGRNALQFYSPEMSGKTSERLDLLRQLRRAVANAEFFLLYQPQVDLRTGEMIAVEALLRWQHPELGVVSPDRFISLAEESGLIVPIGQWVLRTACEQNRSWQLAGCKPVVMAVNVAARQFATRNWIDTVGEVLGRCALDPGYLELELTESMVMHDIKSAVVTMEGLRRIGVHLAIDDFGTGYSNLSALKSFPVGRLKLDRSFVQDLATDEDDRAIAAVVISMGHKLGLQVVAEGIETAEQLAFLKEHGCEVGQGYLFGRPMAASAIEDLLRAETNARTAA